MKTISNEAILRILDMMRVFAIKAQSMPQYMKNLEISGAESTNKRIWALRLCCHKSIKMIARQISLKPAEYLVLEYVGKPVSKALISKLSRLYSVPEDWLSCRKPFYPIPLRNKITQ